MENKEQEAAHDTLPRILAAVDRRALIYQRVRDATETLRCVEIMERNKTTVAHADQALQELVVGMVCFPNVISMHLLSTNLHALKVLCD